MENLEDLLERPETGIVININFSYISFHRF